jgi:TRAP-type C4-dicarboxylate transport system substrate-binding protein
MRNKYLALILIAATMIFAVACGGGGDGSENSAEGGENTAADSGEVHKLRMATHYAEDHAGYASLERAKKTLEEESDGRLEITLYPSSQLGDYTLTFEELMKGSIDLAMIPVPTEFDTKLEMGFIPYLVTEYEQFDRAFGPDSYFFEKYSEIMDGLGIKFLGLYTEGMVGIGTVSEPPADYMDPTSNKQLLIRTPSYESTKVATEAIGYKTVTIPYADLYTAMQTGVCDGWFGGTPQLNYSGFRDVVKYFIPYNFAPENCSFLISKQVDDKLPEDLRTMISEVFTAESQNSFMESQSLDEKAIGDMEDIGIKIMPLTADDRTVLAEHVRESIWPLMEKSIGKDVLDKLLEDVNAA